MMRSPTRPVLRSAPVVDSRGDLLGRVADFTLGTAVVLWHLALAGRDRRRRGPIPRPWSSTR